MCSPATWVRVPQWGQVNSTGMNGLPGHECLVWFHYAAGAEKMQGFRGRTRYFGDSTGCPSASKVFSSEFSNALSIFSMFSTPSSFRADSLII